MRYVWSRSAENSKSIISTMEPVMCVHATTAFSHCIESLVWCFLVLYGMPRYTRGPCLGTYPLNIMCRQKARAMCGEVGFSAILADPKVEAVVLVLPPSVALEV